MKASAVDRVVYNYVNNATRFSAGGGLTRGGNGLGLSNCADFVAAAFGLPDIDAALRGRYLGAVVEDGWYLAWAHWPALYPDAPLPSGSPH